MVTTPPPPPGRNETVERNLGLVGTICNPLARYARGGVPADRDRDDVYQSGVVGLIEAVDSPPPADPSIKFSTAAGKRIRRHAVRGACLCDHGVRIPGHVSAELGRFNAAAARVGRGDPARVAEEMGVRGPSSGRLLAAVEVVGRDWESGDAGAMRSVVDADDGLTAEARIDAKLDAEHLLSMLTPRQRRVVEAVFGIGGGGERTLSEIALADGVSYQAIQQTFNRALAALRRRAGRDERGAA